MGKKDSFKRDCQLAASGDRDAFGRVWVLLMPRLSSIAQRIVGHEARDLLQDCAMVLWQRIGEFDPSRGSFSSWILSRSRFICLDWYRTHRGGRVPMRNHPTTEIVHLLEFDVSGAAPVFDLENRIETEHELSDTIEILDDKGQDVARLMAMGVSRKMIANVIDVPYGTVLSRFRRKVIPQLLPILKRARR